MPRLVLTPVWLPAVLAVLGIGLLGSGLLGIGLLAPRRATAEDDPARVGWNALLGRTAGTFARPGSLAAKRRLLTDLTQSGRTDAWILMFAALEQEGHHLDALAAERRAAWDVTRELWRQPRRVHRTTHARWLRKAFADLAAADQGWFRETMLVGQMQVRLRGAPAEALAEFLKQTGPPSSLAHPIARAAVAGLLAAHAGEGEITTALRPLLERDPAIAVRLAGLHALPADGPATEALILRRLRDRSWIVRLAAARIVRERAMKTAVPLLRRALGEAGPREASTHRATLRALGEDVAQPEQAPVTLYGAPVRSRHVVFVLDCSAAMSNHLGRARTQVADAIEALPAGATFGLVAYNGAVLPWRDEAVAATPATKAAARRWLSGLKAEWNAGLGGALREAFRLAHLAPLQGAQTPIDTVVVVAAGRPTGYARGKAPPLAGEYLERLVRVWNVDRRVCVQTIALQSTLPGAGAELPALLERLAHANEGTFTQR